MAGITKIATVERFLTDFEAVSTATATAGKAGSTAQKGQFMRIATALSKDEGALAEIIPDLAAQGRLRAALKTHNIEALHRELQSGYELANARHQQQLAAIEQAKSGGEALSRSVSRFSTADDAATARMTAVDPYLETADAPTVLKGLSSDTVRNPNLDAFLATRSRLRELLTHPNTVAYSVLHDGDGVAQVVLLRRTDLNGLEIRGWQSTAARGTDGYVVPYSVPANSSALRGIVFAKEEPAAIAAGKQRLRTHEGFAEADDVFRRSKAPNPALYHAQRDADGTWAVIAYDRPTFNHHLARIGKGEEAAPVNWPMLAETPDKARFKADSTLQQVAEGLSAHFLGQAKTTDRNLAALIRFWDSAPQNRRLLWQLAHDETITRVIYYTPPATDPRTINRQTFLTHLKQGQLPESAYFKSVRNGYGDADANLALGEPEIPYTIDDLETLRLNRELPWEVFDRLLDPRLAPLHLSPAEIDALHPTIVTFLETLLDKMDLIATHGTTLPAPYSTFLNVLERPTLLNIQLMVGRQDMGPLSLTQNQVISLLRSSRWSQIRRYPPSGDYALEGLAVEGNQLVVRIGAAPLQP